MAHSELQTVKHQYFTNVGPSAQQSIAQQSTAGQQGKVAGQKSKVKGNRAAGQGSTAAGRSRAGQGSRSGQQAKIKLQSAAEGGTFVKKMSTFLRVVERVDDFLRYC